MSGAPTAALANVLNEGLWRLALEAEGELGMREAIEARFRGQWNCR